MFDASALKDLRGWEHVRKFALGNVELELALSMLVLDAIVLGKKLGVAERDAEDKRNRDEMRRLSGVLRDTRATRVSRNATRSGKTE